MRRNLHFSLIYNLFNFKFLQHLFNFFSDFCAKRTGTALPICLYIEFNAPVNINSSGNVCNIAHSLAESLLVLLIWISGWVAVIVSLGLSQFVMRKDCSNLIFFLYKSRDLLVIFIIKFQYSF